MTDDVRYCKIIIKEIPVSPDTRRVPPPQILLLRRGVALFSGPYEANDYEEFQLLIIFVRIPVIIFNVLNFESIITVLFLFAYSCQNKMAYSICQKKNFLSDFLTGKWGGGGSPYIRAYSPWRNSPNLGLGLPS
jgi:hypothetical protein